MNKYKIIDAGVDFSQDINFKKYLQDEKIMNLIFEVRNDEKTSGYKLEDWMSVCNFANENDCLPVNYLALKNRASILGHFLILSIASFCCRSISTTTNLGGSSPNIATHQFIDGLHDYILL